MEILNWGGMQGIYRKRIIIDIKLIVYFIIQKTYNFSMFFVIFFIFFSENCVIKNRWLVGYGTTTN